LLALKIFKTQFLNSHQDAKEIFIDEIHALSSLDHPHVVKMYECGIEGTIIT
jgi:serine/threonine protein kinase